MKEEVVNKEILVLGAFGPAAESEIDPITKHFKLL
jgi:peptidyl-tRNA hydrolase